MDSGFRRNDGDEVSRHAMIWHGDTPVLPLNALPLAGRHNALNLCAALTALDLIGLDARDAVPAVAGFQPLPHRLQSLGEHGGVQWIDDSISTTPQATLAALESLDAWPVTLILGGHDRGLDWSDFACRVANWPSLQIITQGANGPHIATQLHAASAAAIPCHELDRLKDAVALARRITARGGVVLLSPGAPSFDQFHDYTERGRCFADLAGFNGAVLGSISGLGIA